PILMDRAGANCALRSFPTRRSSDLGAHHGACRGGRLWWVYLSWFCAGHIPDPSRRAAFFVADRAADSGDRGHPAWAECGVLRRRSEEHTSELQSRENIVCRLLLEKK